MSDNRQPKFGERDIRKIVSQLYFAKRIKQEPAKVLRFVRDNKAYFPYLSKEDIQSLMEENGVSDDDVDAQKSVKFTDVDMNLD